jgi:hypothetical protein
LAHLTRDLSQAEKKKRLKGFQPHSCAKIILQNGIYDLYDLYGLYCSKLEKMADGQKNMAYELHSLQRY